MDYFLITLTALVFAVQTLCFKLFNMKYMKNQASYYFFNFMYFCITVAVFFAIGGVPASFHPYTLILGASFGFLFILTILCYMKAMETGPLSFTSLFFSFGLLIPVILGVLIWREKITLIHVTGIVLLLLAFYLGSKSGRVEKRKINIRWIFFCLISFIGNGTLMSLVKGHQMLLPGREIREYLIMGFGAAAALSLALFYRCYSKKQKIGHFKALELGLLTITASVTTVSGNFLSLYLASRVPAAIQFPTVNGGVVMLASIFSVVFFKEKLAFKGIVALIAGVCALFILSLK